MTTKSIQHRAEEAARKCLGENTTKFEFGVLVGTLCATDERRELGTVILEMVDVFGEMDKARDLTDALIEGMAQFQIERNAELIATLREELK